MKSVEAEVLTQVRTLLMEQGDPEWRGIGYDALNTPLDPVCVYSLVGSSHSLISADREWVEMSLDVQCVSGSMVSSSRGQAVLYGIFGGTGIQDKKPKFPVDKPWQVLTSTIEEGISYVERELGTKPVYHMGINVRLVVDRSTTWLD